MAAAAETWLDLRLAMLLSTARLSREGEDEVPRLCGEQARLSLDEQESLVREQATSIWAPGMKATSVLCIGLARTIHIYMYIRCIYGIFCREITIHTYGHLRCAYTVLANPNYVALWGS